MGEYHAIIPALRAAAHAPVVIDGGANIGTFSIAVLNARPDAIVYAFEPSAETFAVLSRNISASRLTHWYGVQAALWQEDGQLLFQNEARSTASHLAHFKKQNAGPREEVKSVSLDSMIKQYRIDHICLLKLDIEGAEEAFLRAAQDKLWMVDHLLMEAHLPRINYPDLLQLIKRNFTVVQELKKGAGKTLVFATRTSSS